MGELEPPRAGTASLASVAVVINCFNDFRFLTQAIESVLAQSVPAEQVIVVDDGSHRHPGHLLARYRDLIVVVQPNAGLASARNAGLERATTRYIAFLDADDEFRPRAIESGLDCFSRSPQAAFVYGAHRYIDETGVEIDGDRYRPIGHQPYESLLLANCVAMHATALYRTDVLRRVGGFDRSLRLCEDYDLYLRIARRFDVASHGEVVADYRRHDSNASNRHRAMLRAVLDVHARYEADPLTDAAIAWRQGRKDWIAYYVGEAGSTVRTEWTGRRRPSRLLRLFSERVLVVLTYLSLGEIRHKGLRRLASVRRKLSRWPPGVGKVRLGDLGGVRPVSMEFGYDRGLPIDRYYIEQFLSRHCSDVRGAVLEVGDDSYSRRFGGDRIDRQDVLHVDPENPHATIVGDLSDATVLGRDRFDCIVLTQTLHLIYDFRTAVVGLHEALTLGGVALVTVPGISPIDRGAWGNTWYWSFTAAAVIRLFGDVFGPPNVAVEAHGNVYAATLFLQGLALGEVKTAKLDVRDEAYPIIVTVRACKTA